MPLSATAIMFATVVATVITHNLAVGVVLGVIVAALFFAARVAHFTEVVDVAHPDENTRVYAVRGVLFFASSNDLVYQFDYVGDPAKVIIDLSGSQIFDASTVAALDAIEVKYREKGKEVEIIGLNEPSLAWHSRLSGKLGSGH
ncbi:STAS domain-containing protein [Microlunatus speluncae]|uniref:STAS domain-containing protein n=1 Tax=Microlunatus speluncae TaxID=2594267 RepID=UPI001C2CF70B|nr:STAS domain-containing protein [Microlunatus speluncae]